MMITANQLKQALMDIAVRIEQEKDYLSELDRALGDGDHGVTMSIGWQAIVEKLQELEGENNCGEICKAVGMTFLNAVGSSVGPLYATAFLRGGMAIQGKSELNQEDIIRFWVTAINGIQERGKAQPGDKTMMDSWIPAIEALQHANNQGEDLLTCLDEAVTAGEQGMKSTINMLSQKGRSSRLGDRSLGHQDPGATSAYLLLSCFRDSMKSALKQNVQENVK
jgi:dihydroxyacetone kinase-like protein